MCVMDGHTIDNRRHSVATPDAGGLACVLASLIALQRFEHQDSRIAGVHCVDRLGGILRYHRSLKMMTFNIQPAT